jgi:hypothetical protein
LGVHAQRDRAPAARPGRSGGRRLELVEHPRWPPRSYTRRAEARNAENTARAPAAFARYVGAPVVHGAISGAFACKLPELPLARYRGFFEGGAQIAAADGRVLARREPSEGSGVVITDVEAHRSTPIEPVPDRFWLHPRGALPALVWNTQRLLGRPWYARNARGRAPLVLADDQSGLSSPEPQPDRAAARAHACPHGVRLKHCEVARRSPHAERGR